MVKVGDMFGTGAAGEGRPEADAQRLLREGNFVAAGRLLESAGRLAQAAEAYLQGHEYALAADVYARLGRREQAAELHLKAGDVKRSAEALARTGNTARAAELLLQRGQSLEAAKLYAQAEIWDKAAELYDKGGYPLRAAQAYERHGDLLRAAECYERHFVENVAYGASPTSATSSDHKAALQAGQLYVRAGDPQRALQILARAGFQREAAEAAELLGEHEKAAEHYTRAEDLARAADSWEKAGRPVQAALLRGEVAFKEDRMPEAAAFFQQGQDYYRAGELFESLGLQAEAAAAYEAGGSYNEAASVYLRAGDNLRAAAAFQMARQFELAAKLFEDEGDPARAAQLYEKAGLPFKSGELAARAGDREKAIALLQRVEPADEKYSAASELLARMFLEVGMAALAIERLQQSLAGQPIASSNVSLYYWLAFCAEAGGDSTSAATIYKQILAIDFGFRDVSRRLQALQGGAGPVSGSEKAAPATEYEVVEVLPPSPPLTPAAPGSAVPAGGPRLVTKELVGHGPLGAVYRAEDQTDFRSMALRVLPERALAPDVFEAAVSELVAATRVSHPNLVRVLGVVDLNGQSCVLSEFVQGDNLADQLAAGQRMSVQQCHSLGRTLAQVLGFLHAHGLVHGSLRPSNIMVVSGVLKLADLGLGRLHHAAQPPDAYRAPEGALDVAGDVFGLGAVLYHALTGVPPKVRSEGPLNRPGQLAPGVPERFDRFLMRCLEPSPDRRFPAADDLTQALEAMITIS